MSYKTNFVQFFGDEWRYVLDFEHDWFWLDEFKIEISKESKKNIGFNHFLKNETFAEFSHKLKNLHTF